MNTIDSLSKKMLLVLLDKDEPSTAREIAKIISVSSRTVLRKINIIEDFLQKRGYGLTIRPGYGIYIEDSKEDKLRLKKILLSDNKNIKYSPRERQNYILIELLKSKEPIKMYGFSDELNVTEGTISGDLDKIENIVEKYNLRLIRRPGYGILIEGSEQDFRKLMVNLIYENQLDKELLSFIGNKVKSKIYEANPVQIEVNNRLLNMVDGSIIKGIESIVSGVEVTTNYRLSDSQYVALIVHLSLAVERIKSGDRIHMNAKSLETLKKREEFEIGSKIALEIEKSFEIEIPQDEIGYITMHLMSRNNKINEFNTDDDFYLDRYRLIRTSRSMLKVASEIQGIDLLKDEKLLLDLALHLEVAIKRINMGLDIRNPLLDQIKSKYTAIYNCAKDVSEILGNEFNIKIPDTEIGYIAIHIGGAIERINNYIYKVAVVCPSGIGTSKLLSTKVNNELNNIIVLRTYSIIELENGDEDLQNVDFLISTVPLNTNRIPWVMVSPLLLEDDVKKIQNTLNKIVIRNRKNKVKVDNKEDFQVYLKSQIAYSNAILEIMDNFIYEERSVKTYEEIFLILEELNFYREGGWQNLKEDIERREALGGIVLQESKTMIVHCRSDEVFKLNVIFIKLSEPYLMEKEEINQIIVLLAPKDVGSEYLEVIGSISQGLIKRDLPESTSYEEIKNYIAIVLEEFYSTGLNKRG